MNKFLSLFKMCLPGFKSDDMMNTDGKGKWKISEKLDNTDERIYKEIDVHDLITGNWISSHLRAALCIDKDRMWIENTKGKDITHYTEHNLTYYPENSLVEITETSGEHMVPDFKPSPERLNIKIDHVIEIFRIKFCKTIKEYKNIVSYEDNGRIVRITDDDGIVYTVKLCKGYEVYSKIA